ncbi:MAG TPA: FG-GAP-like repeat-containing protein [Gemmataceae bacterium]|nr:FG-GAP-like repeat-containing protein [Gemmataceae bacterium]
MNPSRFGRTHAHKPGPRVRIVLEELEPRDTPTFVATPPGGFTNGLDDPQVVAAGDFNGDGKADLAVGNGTGSTGDPGLIQILLGNGNGTFTTGQQLALPAGEFPNAIITFDANRDGRLDLAVTTGIFDSTTVFLGKGDGTFVQSFIDPRPAFGITAGLFNADNVPDLVTIASGGGFQVFLGKGDGTFTTGASGTGTLTGNRLVTGDFDGDGKQDFAGLDRNNGRILAYYGNGNGTFSGPFTTNVAAPVDIVAGDFNGDGLTDVAVAEGKGEVRLHLGTAGRTFTAPGTRIDPASTAGANLFRLAAGDLNRDGRPDLISLDEPGTARVAFNAGGGNFTADNPAAYPSAAGTAQDVAIAEFDGDLNTDFVVVYGSEFSPIPIPPTGQVFLNAAPDPTVTTVTAVPNPSTFGTTVTLTARVVPAGGVPGTPVGTVTFTIDGVAQPPVPNPGGVATITVPNFTVGVHPVFAQYTGGTNFEASTSPTIQVVVNAPPLILAGSDNGEAICMFSPDTSLRGGANAFGPGFTGVRPAAGDFTGDGFLDVVVGSGPGDPSRVALMDGRTRRFITAFSPFGDAFTGGVFVAAGDINGDGRADLAVSADMGGGSRVRVFLNQAGGFVPVADFLALDDPNFRGGVRIALGDVNRDGFADLIAAAGPGGGARIAGFDGRSLSQGRVVHIFHDFFAFDPNSRVGAFVAAGDVNRDGFAEIVVGAAEGGSPRVSVFDGQSLAVGGSPKMISNFFAGPEDKRGGIRVGVRDFNSDGFADIITGPGGQDGSKQRVFSGISVAAGGSALLFERDPFPGLNAGIYIG